MTAQATDSVLPVIERHLAAAGEHIREAQEDHERLRRAADETYEADPARAGTLRAHATMTMNRWTEALGARAALEALYQELAGRPSADHAHTTQTMQGIGHKQYRVGLEDRHPETAELLAELEEERGVPGGGE